MSRRESQVLERKGSMLRASVSKFGASGEKSVSGFDWRAEREVGSWSGSEGGLTGSWWRKVVRRCELWIVRGSSCRMSW